MSKIKNEGFYLIPTQNKANEREKSCPICPVCGGDFFIPSKTYWAYHFKKTIDGLTYNVFLCSLKCDNEFRRRIAKGEMKEYGKKF